MSMEDALLVVNRAGVTLLTNATYARMFGHADAHFEARDAEGQPLPVAETPQQRATQGPPFTQEFTLDADTGERRYYEATGRSIPHEDLGGVLVIRDITERSLHRLQDRFMALAGHELRPPLTVLHGTLQVLLKALATAPESRTLTEKALVQCRRLTRLVDELLDATRLQYDRYALQREPVELQRLVAEVIEAIRLTEPRPSIHFDAPDAPLVIQADAGRLHQIVLNLLTNALTHAPTSARIDVRLRRVDDEAQLQVQDDGPGIPAADLPNLFERFYQGNGQERHAGIELGLGLYITKQLVLAHGGHIAVESVEGQGATFSVSLPLLPSADQAGETADPSRAG